MCRCTPELRTLWCGRMGCERPDVVGLVDEIFHFGRALEALKAGRRVTRAGWNGRGMWLELQRPDAHSKMTLPYVYMRTAQGDLVPWLASQTDLLADDWRLAPPRTP